MIGEILGDCEITSQLGKGIMGEVYQAKDQKLGACPRIRRGRVPGAAGADARRRDAGDVVTSSRSANEADAPAPPGTRRARGDCGRSLRCSSSTM